MTTYTKETALYDTGAIANDIQDAGAQVSKYITSIGDEGIKVHPYNATAGQADTDNYAKIDADGMEIWQKPTGASASVKVAEFGASGAQIGEDNKSHLVMDYHSLQLKDRENDYYLYISDRRDEDGTATLEAEFTGDGTTNTFDVGVAIDTLISAIDSGDASNIGSISPSVSRRVVFPNAPALNSQISISFTTVDNGAKAYTLGTRDTSYDILGASSVVLNRLNAASGPDSCASGYRTKAIGNNAHAEGYLTTSSGTDSHAEGRITTASENSSHAEGYNTTASGHYSHAEGYNTTASEYASHAEGWHTTASVIGSHAEGHNTTASSWCSHAEGSTTKASGQYSHAEGYNTTASGHYSHAEGWSTKASGQYSHVMGYYNKEDDSCYTLTTDTAIDDNKTYYTYNSYGYYVEVSNPDVASITSYYEYSPFQGDKAFIIGNGRPSNRSNALTVDWAGNVKASGDVTDGSGNSMPFIADKDVTTYAEILAAINAGKDVLARVPNGYDSYNYYTFSYASSGALNFTRFHGSSPSTCSCYLLSVDSTDTWTSTDWGLASSDVIGTGASHVPEPTSCATGKYCQVAYLALDPGMYMINANALFPSTNATGIRQVRITTATSGYNNVSTPPSAIGNIAISSIAGGNYSQYPSVHCTVSPTERTTYRLVAYQSSGSTMNVTGRLYVFRIK